MNENKKIIKQIADETEEKEENSKTYLDYIQRTKGGHRFDKILQEGRGGGSTIGSTFYWRTWALLFTALLWLLSFCSRLIR